MNRKVTIGTRGSDLALWQANYISDLLKTTCDLEVDLKIIKTRGDEIQHLGFDKMEGKGFFTKEIEQALLNNEIDIAVHSHKDLETKSPKGLVIGAVTEREDPSELLLINSNAIDETQMFSLKQGAVVGTSAPRRKSQISAFREDVEVKDLRGNVPTRVGKLLSGDYDAILIAKAGVTRLKLDLSACKVVELDKRQFIPAPAQGALGIQIREDDESLAKKLKQITHNDTLETISIERKVLNEMEGGCQIPLGVYCKKLDEGYALWAAYAKSVNDITKRVYLEGFSKNELVERTVEILKESCPDKTVFISRSLHENSILKRILTKNNYKTIDLPLVKFEELPVARIPETEWIFFSSKNAVRFYLNRFTISNNIKIGVIGSSTKSALKRKGFKVDFVGEGIDTKLIGVEFKNVVGSSKVLFPMVQNGSTNVLGAFSSEQVEVVKTYKTVPILNRKIPKANILVFTSPSNVESYLQTNKINSDHKIVAIGNTTAKKLIECGFQNFILPWNPNELAITDSIISLS